MKAYVVRIERYNLMTGKSDFYDIGPFRWRWFARLVAAWHNEIDDPAIAKLGRVIDTVG